MAIVSVGDVFGELEVLSVFFGERNSGLKSYKAECRCVCGNISEYERGNLTSGNSKNCTDCRNKKAGAHKVTHGHSCSRAGAGTVEAKNYYTWQAMKRRCMVETNSRWADYGGRGISICAEWIASYESFLADMGLPPTMAHQIDRADNDGNYCKQNCSWVTATENGRNKRNNVMMTYLGRTMTQSAWASELGIKRETISMRLRRGYSQEAALAIGNGKASMRSYNTDDGEFASLSAAAEHHGISTSGAHGRFKSAKYPLWVSS
jgi:hypothetical protein